MIASLIGMKFSIKGRETTLRAITLLDRGVKINGLYVLTYEELATMVDTGIMPERF